MRSHRGLVERIGLGVQLGGLGFLGPRAREPGRRHPGRPSTGWQTRSASPRPRSTATPPASTAALAARISLLSLSRRVAGLRAGRVDGARGRSGPWSTTRCRCCSARPSLRCGPTGSCGQAWTGSCGRWRRTGVPVQDEIRRRLDPNSSGDPPGRPLPAVAPGLPPLLLSLHAQDDLIGERRDDLVRIGGSLNGHDVAMRLTSTPRGGDRTSHGGPGPRRQRLLQRRVSKAEADVGRPRRPSF